MEYKVSVIVPVYNVERFIARCVKSLMEQTLREVEYIFVNDASPDNSWGVLKNLTDCYPSRMGDVVLLEHSENKGLPASRNTGLSVARGEYVFHCDSDDFVETDMLEALYAEAKRKHADIVWCDWFLSFEKNERYMRQPCFSTAKEALKSMLGGGMKYNVWNKLVKRSLYIEHDISFPSGHGMGEDMTMMLLFAYANNVSYFPKAFYHYVKTNTTAISRVISDRSWADLKYNVNRVENFIKHIYGTGLDKEIAFLKLEAKFPLLVISSDFSYYRLWHDMYPEADCFILKNKNVSLRSRIIQRCAHYRLFGIVWLHYQVVCRFFYGIVYR